MRKEALRIFLLLAGIVGGVLAEPNKAKAG
jgi:hypothetical protein